MFNYAVNIIPDETGGYYVTCDDLPEFNSSGDSIDECLVESIDGIEATLSIYTDNKQSIPKARQARSGQHVIYLPVATTAKIILWNSLLEKNISQAELARRLGISPQAASRLFDFLHRSKIEQLEAALAILGKRINVVEAA